MTCSFALALGLSILVVGVAALVYANVVIWRVKRSQDTRPLYDVEQKLIKTEETALWAHHLEAVALLEKYAPDFPVFEDRQKSRQIIVHFWATAPPQGDE